MFSEDLPPIKSDNPNNAEDFEGVGLDCYAACRSQSLNTPPYKPPKGMVDGIERWVLGNLKDIIPEEMHSMYMNSNNVLFAFEKNPLNESEDVSLHTEWVCDLTNNGKRSILSSFDTNSCYTNLTYRKERERKMIALDHKTDPAFLRVTEPKTGKYILSNLVKCASEQRGGLIKYVEYVRRNIDSVPLLEELNRFALAQKIAYRSARNKLWFILSLAEELKLVERSSTFAFKLLTSKFESSREDFDIFAINRYSTQRWCRRMHPSLGSSTLNSNQTDRRNISNLGMLPVQNYTDDNTLLNDSMLLTCEGFGVSTCESGQPLYGFSSLGIANNTPTTSELTQKLYVGFPIDTPCKTLGMWPENAASASSSIFENFMDTPKDHSLYDDSTIESNWQALGMLKKHKVKPTEQKSDYHLQKTMAKIIGNRTKHALKNAIATVSALEAACRLYGKGPKWCNPNKNEFDISNKHKKLVYIRPSKSVKNTDMAYQYLMQYASIHQKLNGGTRQEHAVSYGIITLDEPLPGEHVKSFKVNPNPWFDPIYSPKWSSLKQAIGGNAPWVVSGVCHPSHGSVSKPTEETEFCRLDMNSDSASKTVDGKCELQSKEELQRSFPETAEEKESKEGLRRSISETAEDKESREESQRSFPETAENKEKQSRSSYTLENNEEYNNISSVFKDNVDKSDSESNPDVNTNDISDGTTKDTKNSVTFVHACDTEFNDENFSNDKKNVDIVDDLNIIPKTTKNIIQEPEKCENLSVQDPPKPLGTSKKQMKLTQLFHYIYTKVKKTKPLPDFPPELFSASKQHVSLPTVLSPVKFSGKKKRIIDDDYIPEEALSDYNLIDEPQKERENDIDRVVFGGDMSAENPEEAGEPKEESVKSGISKKEKIHKIREFMKNMLDFEAEESDDENLSDPEDIKRSLQLLRERLQHSSEDSESEYESEADLEGFIGEVEPLNEEDENIARQKFYADMEAQEENELAKLMPLKERCEHELTKREARAKLFAQLKKSRGKRTMEDFHLSDFESSDEYDSQDHKLERGNKTVGDKELKQLLSFKNGERPTSNVSKTDELERFIDFKLQNCIKDTDVCSEVPLKRNLLGEVLNFKTQVGREMKNRREMVDNFLASDFNSIFSAIDADKTVLSDKSMQHSGSIPESNPNVAAYTANIASPKKFRKLLTKSFISDCSSSVNLSMTNSRNIEKFTGFHSFTDTFSVDRKIKKIRKDPRGKSSFKP